MVDVIKSAQKRHVSNFYSRGTLLRLRPISYDCVTMHISMAIFQPEVILLEADALGLH